MCEGMFCLDPLGRPIPALLLGLPALFTFCIALYTSTRVERTAVSMLLATTLTFTGFFQLNALLVAISENPGTAEFWGRMLSWAPVCTAVTGVHFSALLLEVWWARRLRFVVPLYAGGSIIVMSHLTRMIHLRPEDRGPLLGWMLHNEGPMDAYQRGFAGLCILTLLALQFTYWWTYRRHPQRGTGAAWIFWGNLIPIGGAIAVVSMPVFGLPSLPLFQIFAPVFQLGALIAITRHGLFEAHDVETAKALVGAMDEAVIVVDAQQRLLFVNAHAERVFGIDPGKIERGLPLEAPPKIVEGIAAAAAGTAQRLAVDFKGLATQISFSPIPRRTRTDVAMVVSDERENRAKEAALEQARRDAEAARDAAFAADNAKSTFLANMSHELRTPLNAIIGYGEMLSEDIEDAEAQRDLGRIVTSGRYLLALIGDILDLSKLDAGRLEVHTSEFEVGPLVEELRSTSLQLCAKKGNELSLHVTPARVSGDPIRVRQILLNLVSNATKFTENGSVQIDVESTRTMVRIRVRDTGIGMNPEQLSQLFGRFQQVHRTHHGDYGGTGLGLALSRELATQMGGGLTATSKAGVGSTFTLSLQKA